MGALDILRAKIMQRNGLLAIERNPTSRLARQKTPLSRCGCSRGGVSGTGNPTNRGVVVDGQPTARNSAGPTGRIWSTIRPGPELGNRLIFSATGSIRGL